jgi:FkbM family methyltransferase
MSAKSELERLARLASRAVYIGDHEAIALVLGRFQMFLPTTDRGIFPHLALTGFWESWVTLAMMALVKPGMYVVNVGANVGYYALLFADLVGSSGRVIAYEPNGELAELVERSAALNGYRHLVTRYRAVSDTVGVDMLVVPPGHAMNAHLRSVRGPDGYVRPRSVEVTTLDVSMQDDVTVPHVVFIDAEGSEEAIWRGMTRVRKERSTIVMEYSPKRYADPLAFAKEFTEDGFAIGFVHESGAVHPSTPEALASGPEVMVVLTREPVLPGPRARIG